MRAGALSAQERAGAETVRPPSRAALAASWAAMVVTTLSVAAVVALAAPDLADGETVELPDSPLLIVAIFSNNVLLCLLPLLGGWLAAGHRLAGRPALAWCFLAISSLVVARSVVTVGAVGGSDGAWLVDAARWVVLELGALAVAAHTGLWLARHPEQRGPRTVPALRRAFVFVLSALAVGAVVEVLTA